MVNRCDSVDALMYAYYEFMRKKEENQMLKKNEDYVEFTLQYTSVDWARDKDHPEVCFNGYSNFDFPGVPIMDVVCKDFSHKVVMISKSDFERLQARADSNAEAWESDYNHLLALTGFDNEGEIEDFLEQNNDRNKLTTVIDNLKLENEAMKTVLRASNLAIQKELENNIDEWQKFTESNWQGVTGFSTPEKCSSYIDRLEKKLEDIKNLTEED